MWGSSNRKLYVKHFKFKRQYTLCYILFDILFSHLSFSVEANDFQQKQTAIASKI